MGARFRRARSIALETGSRALVGDAGVPRELSIGPLLLGAYLFSGLVRVDLTSGAGELVSGGGIGSGKRGHGAPFLLNAPGSIAMEPGGSAALVKGGLCRVDLASGDRKTIVRHKLGYGLGFADVAVEPSGTWITVDSYDSVVRVDPTTGAQSIVSNPFRGSGPRFYKAWGVLVEPSGSLLVVIGTDAFPFPYQLMRVDPATGDRTILSRN